MLFQTTETSVESICSEVTKLRQAAHIDDYNCRVLCPTKRYQTATFVISRKRERVIDTRGTLIYFLTFIHGGNGIKPDSNIL